jgi:hypothetical protein
MWRRKKARSGARRPDPTCGDAKRSDPAGVDAGRRIPDTTTAPLGGFGGFASLPNHCGVRAAPPDGSGSWARNGLTDGLGNGLTSGLLNFF